VLYRLKRGVLIPGKHRFRFGGGKKGGGGPVCSPYAEPKKKEEKSFPVQNHHGPQKCGIGGRGEEEPHSFFVPKREGGKFAAPRPPKKTRRVAARPDKGRRRTQRGLASREFNEKMAQKREGEKGRKSKRTKRSCILGRRGGLAVEKKKKERGGDFPHETPKGRGGRRGKRFHSLALSLRKSGGEEGKGQERKRLTYLLAEKRNSLGGKKEKENPSISQEPLKGEKKKEYLPFTILEKSPLRRNLWEEERGWLNAPYTCHGGGGEPHPQRIRRRRLLV